MQLLFICKQLNHHYSAVWHYSAVHLQFRLTHFLYLQLHHICKETLCLFWNYFHILHFNLLSLICHPLGITVLTIAHN